GRSRRAGPGVPRGRRAVARGGMLDVHRGEPRPTRPGPAQRVDLQPEFRGAPGRSGSNASGLPAHGGRDGCRGPARGAGGPVSGTPTIAVLAGDGIGPEVMAPAIAVLRAVGSFDFAEYPVGAAAIARTGSPLPDETLAACTEA